MEKYFIPSTAMARIIFLGFKGERSVFLLISLGLLVLSLGLSGCNRVPTSLSEATQEISRGLASLSGKPGSEVTAAPSGEPSPREGELSSSAAKNAKMNAEILAEMMRVIFIKDPSDRSAFGNWADSMNQGASAEGVYNGLTHSADYRKLEIATTVRNSAIVPGESANSGNPGASVEALKLFGEELAYLENELPIPTQFDSTSASPLPTLGTVDASTGNEVVDFNNQTPSLTQPSSLPKTDVKVLAEQYSKQFVGASIYTLKRVLGDEALKVFASKSEYKEKLALWYSKWVVRLVQRNVDFGIPLRNKPDEAFHYKWALETNSDLIKWEVLNRLHRLLNEANRQKQ